MQSSSSTSLLAPSTSAYLSSSRKWEGTFGKLASSYGFSAGAPSLPKKSKNGRSVTSKISTTPTSISQASHPHALQSHKDYEAAFGSLSSAYGFAGGVPSVPSKNSKKTRSSTFGSAQSMSQSSTACPPKDYQDAFGNLSASYGFGGATSPSWGTRK